MYADKLSIYDFKCFGKAVLDLQYPGRPKQNPDILPNINVILGDNGGGKSSVLRALAVAVLAPSLMESGFVPFRLVRRPGAKKSLLKVDGILSAKDLLTSNLGEEKVELLARLERRENGNLDRLHLESTPNSPLEKLIYDDTSPAYFIVGYGAMRRIETGDFSPSSSRRMRGLRYERVAGLFEDHVALQPLEAWLKKAKKRKSEAVELINSILPENINFEGKFDEKDEGYVFDFDGIDTPYASLSDGYRAFIAFVGDLIARLIEIAPNTKMLSDISGIVLVDEVDLHLHPSWQRTVIEDLSKAFPKIQFLMTSHSALIVNSVHHENIFLTEKADNGTATIVKSEENSFGRSVDQILLSSYFGLDTTRPVADVQESEALVVKAMKGDHDSALEYLKRLETNSKPSSSREQGE